MGRCSFCHGSLRWGDECKCPGRRAANERDQDRARIAAALRHMGRAHGGDYAPLRAILTGSEDAPKEVAP